MADLPAIRDHLARIRRRRGLTEEEPPTLSALAEATREIHGMFRDSDYAGAVAALPTAVASGRRTVAALDGDERQTAWWQLAQIYQTAGMVLTQLRRDDLAYHSIGLA